MIEILNTKSASPLKQTSLNGAYVCEGDERSRILRTCRTSSRAIGQTDLPGFDSLASSKISDFPSMEVVDRVEQIAENSGIRAASSAIDTDHILELLDQERDLLTNPEIPLSEEANALFSADEPEAERRNFLIQVNQLVAEIMKLLSELSDRDRKKTDHMKKEYDKFNNFVVGSIKEKGWWNLGGTGAALIANLIGAAFNAPSGIAQAFGGIAQSGVGIFISQNEATTSKYSNKLSMISTDLQNTANKGSDNSGWKQELIQSLNDIKEWMRASVRTNG